MAANYLKGQGCTVGIDDVGASPVSYTTIGELVSFSTPEETRTEIDVTTLASTHEEITVGLRKGGTLTLEVNYYPGDVGQTELEAALVAGTEKSFKVTFTDSPASTWTGNGYVVGMSVPVEMDSKISCTYTIRQNGAWVRA